MKKAALITFALALLMGGVLVYGLMGTRLTVIPQSVQVVAGEEQIAEFERVKGAVNNRSLIGTAFTAELPGEPSEYRFVIYTVEVRNKGLLPAKMASLEISPADGDAASYTDFSSKGKIPDITIPAGGSAVLRRVLVTTVGSKQGTVRDLFISYHIWGHPFTVKVTYG